MAGLANAQADDTSIRRTDYKPLTQEMKLAGVAAMFVAGGEGS
jgi:hypothetical protein